MTSESKDGIRTIELGNTNEFRDELNALILAGKKRATAGALEWDYEEGEPVEKVGEKFALLDNYGKAIATIQATRVEIVEFINVPDDFALAEGEGDLSADDFRRSHLRYWASDGYKVRDDSPIVLMYFEVLRDAGN
jgi:uncharacterized protein YhfF